MKKLLSNRRFIKFAALLAASAVLFSFTEASRVPSLFIIIGFLLLTGVIYYIIYGLMSALALYGFRVRRKQLVAGYLTAALAIMVALQSVGEMGRWDFWVLLPLAILAYFYSSYARAK